MTYDLHPDRLKTTLKKRLSVQEFMKKIVSLLLILMVSTVGCTIGIFVGVNTNEIVGTQIEDLDLPSENPNPVVFSPKNTDRAFQIFYSEWITEFNEGKDDLILKDALEKVFVEFTRDKIPVDNGYSMDGTPFPPGEVVMCHGLTNDVDHIQVWGGEEPHKIGKTSFVHELVHVSLKVKYGFYDSDHLGNIYKGWTKKHNEFIDKTKKKLLELSL